MGMFDEIMALTGLGGSPQAQQHIAALGAVLGYINSPQVGGIPGLQIKFQQQGLGGVLSSWVGSGENQPISVDQLQNVLHSDALRQAAQKVGIDPDQLTKMMTQLLPHVVDKLTPNGQVPDSGATAQITKGLAPGQSER
jgi:uncharacterized protein YidB (DUF937 family)